MLYSIVCNYVYSTAYSEPLNHYFRTETETNCLLDYGTI